ncbi:MAG: hypothetical protein II920_07560, partial [Clostridia bacterium]|nr:hypothetical protein [Clostridia bacterium]
LLLTERFFNPCLRYGSFSQNSNNVSCFNCGADIVSASSNGACPICGSPCNVSYLFREEAGKHVNVASEGHLLLYAAVFVVLLAICEAVSFMYVKTTGRTFGTFDILKAAVLGLGAALVFYFIVYTMFARITTARLKRNYLYKTERLNAFESGLKA